LNKKSEIKNLLSGRMAHYGFKKQYDASLICEEADKVSGGQFMAISCRAGVLKVKVRSASRAHLVRMNQDQIISKINEALGEEKVKRMRFEIEK